MHNQHLSVTRMIPRPFLLSMLLMLVTNAAVAQMPPEVPAPPAQPVAQLPSTSLTVTGQGDVFVDSDRAFVTLGATAQAETAEQAQQQVNQVMQRAIQDIREIGIEQEAIRTRRLSLYPVYSEARPQQGRQHEPRIVGYRASNTVEVRLDDLARIGPVIDAGIEAGMNQLEGIQFDLRDPTSAQQNALRRAAQQATQKAEALADALDMRLDGLAHAYEAAGPVIPLRMDRAMVAAERFATPVEPGQIQVQASVTLVYRIAEPVD